LDRADFRLIQSIQVPSLQKASYTIDQKQLHCGSIKNKQNYFCYNYVKLRPDLIIFGTKMANSLKLYEVHSFSTSPNSHQCTTVLNADVQNCYLTLIISLQ